MKKLNVAIIGQGRSGHNIHGTYMCSPDNLYYTVKFSVIETVHAQNPLPLKF